DIWFSARESGVRIPSGSQVMFFVYILKSKRDGRYYVGCTNNVLRRLSEHNNGLSKYTKNFIPWDLVYKESFMTLKEARKREKQIKSWKKRLAIEKLIKDSVV
ncbi:MAG: GIY-YIG nuclease family protein, partial [Microgenomates group bacterium]